MTPRTPSSTHTRWERGAEFLRDRIWQIRTEELSLRHRIVLRPARVILLALRGFAADRLQVQASALTYYSLLSVVPLLAVAFGIAKGFGLQETLERQIRERVQGQEEILTRIIDIANVAVAEARGGLVAGIGVAFLFWAAIRLLGNIEVSLNSIWGVKDGRPLTRRVFDYLSLILIAPILLTIAGALNAKVGGLAAEISMNLGTLPAGLMETLVGTFLPFLMLVLFFALLYRVIPNTNVSLRSALFAALVAGALYQLTQSAYIRFQVYMTSYNAVYGTFAALPLFLIWLNLSWLVVLLGAEISFAIDNEESYASERMTARVSPRVRRVVALGIVREVAQRFSRGEEPLNAIALASQLELSVRLVRRLLYDLIAAGVLVEVQVGEDESLRVQPARSLESLTVASIIAALEDVGGSNLEPGSESRLANVIEAMRGLEKRIVAADENVRVVDL